jgi:small subunit ribosomal protein S20
MANIKSQIKRIKTNEKARLRNKAYKSELKTAIRRTREAIAAGDAAKAQEAAAFASRKLDKAVSKGVIHANQAANKKSALAKPVNANNASTRRDHRAPPTTRTAGPWHARRARAEGVWDDSPGETA